MASWTVERPVELDLAPIGDIASEQSVASVDHILVDGRRIKIEAVLLFGLRYGCTNGERNRQITKHIDDFHQEMIH